MGNIIRKKTRINEPKKLEKFYSEIKVYEKISGKCTATCTRTVCNTYNHDELLELQALLSERSDVYITFYKVISKYIGIGTFIFLGNEFLSKNKQLNNILVPLIREILNLFALVMIGAVLLLAFKFSLLDYANHERNRLIVKNVVDECLLEGKKTMKNCKKIPNKKIFNEIVEEYINLINQGYKDEQAMEKAIYKHIKYFKH